MNAPSWRTRALALLQVILVVPPLVAGSICISADGSERSELGFCDCTVPVAGGAEAALGSADPADCGPCRDEAFSALRGTRPSGPGAPAPASPFLLAGVADLAPSMAGLETFWSGEPPTTRHPILRC